MKDSPRRVRNQMEKLNALSVDEGKVKSYIDNVVRDTVEALLNELLDLEADELCGAKRYEHSKNRLSTRAGKYKRNLLTRVGNIQLEVPKLRQLRFESEIIERYRRREISVEEALIQMYLAGVSVRRVNDITEALWGARVSSSTISALNKKVYKLIEEWRNKPLEDEYPYVYLDGILLKRSWAGEVRNVSVLVAVGVSRSGYREVLGVAEGCKEDKESWLNFLRWLKGRGLRGVHLFINDRCLGLIEALSEVYPGVNWQRCIVHFYRNILSSVPKSKVKEVSMMLKAIYSQESKEEAKKKALFVIERLKEMKLFTAAKILEIGYMETLTYYDFPTEHHRCIRTNNLLERVNREIRRRTSVVGSFPDGASALMLVAARLHHIENTWSTNKYLDMEKLYNKKEDFYMAS